MLEAQHMPSKNSAHLLTKRNIQCEAPRAKWDVVHIDRGKENTMEVDLDPVCDELNFNTFS